jgi:DNA-binding response OmpR family regulator
MMRTVLAVGNCAYDHADIERAISGRFDAKVIRAPDLEKVLETLRSAPVDLVLVNRRLHADSSDGLEVIRRIKAELDLPQTEEKLRRFLG